MEWCEEVFAAGIQDVTLLSLPWLNGLPGHRRGALQAMCQLQASRVFGAAGDKDTAVALGGWTPLDP